MSGLTDFLSSAREVGAEAIQAARDISDSPHAAPIHAMIRQGADEMAQVLPAFPAQGLQPVSEMGQLFEITPGMATEQIKGPDAAKDHEMVFGDISFSPLATIRIPHGSCGNQVVAGSASLPVGFFAPFAVSNR